MLLYCCMLGAKLDFGVRAKPNVVESCGGEVRVAENLRGVSSQAE
jgi:hypothetical protein